MSLLTIAQVAVSLILVILILLQERSGGMSGILGGGVEGGYYQTRRGLEKSMFVATIVLVAVFAILSLLNLLR